MFSYIWRHQKGFQEKLYIHLPINILSKLVSFSPDVIISGEMGFRTIQAIVFKLFYSRTKIVLWATLSEHTEVGRDLIRVIIRKVILSCCDAVIVNGESGARYIRKYNFPSDRIIRSPYTTDLALTKERQTPLSKSNKRRIICVGRIEERKGLLPFLECLTEWCTDNPERTIEFSIVGTGPLISDLQSVSLPVNLTLNLVGNIPYNELSAYYIQAHLFAFPTLADEWGMVVSEAMACGLPVLGSIYSQAVEELVQDGITGWLFRPDYKDEMYKSLDKALNASHDQLAAMRMNVIKVIQRQTPEYAAKKMLEAIEIALSQT